jgi:hypothetical protein
MNASNFSAASIAFVALGSESAASRRHSMRISSLDII